MNRLLPRAGASVVRQDGIPTGEFRRFLESLAAGTDSATLQAEIAAIIVRLDALEAGGGDDIGLVLGGLSIRHVGNIHGGNVTLSLVGDEAAPGSNFAYVTDALGVKGWQERLLATLADVDATTTPPALGDALVFDSADGLWKPSASKENKFDFSGTVMLSNSMGGFVGGVWDKLEPLIQTTATAKATLFGQGISVRTGDPYPDLQFVRLADAIASGNWSAATAAAAASGTPEVIAGVASLAAADWSTVNRLLVWMDISDQGYFIGTTPAPLGAITDTVETTFRGAINKGIATILAAFPQIQINFLTATYHDNVAAFVNGLGFTAADYVDALLERGRAHQFPVLDMYRLGGINADNSSHYMSDVVHQNAAGGSLQAGIIAGWMRSGFSSSAPSILATAITNGDQTHAPTGDAVFDALALKADVATVHSGTYVPVISSTSNVDASTPFVLQYLRVGNTVTVSGRIDINPTAAATATSFRMTLPVVSNFDSPARAGGQYTVGASTPVTGYITAVASTQLALVTFISSGDANLPGILHFTYRIM